MQNNFWEKNDLFWVFIIMKKILRLTESDLVRLVKRVISEQSSMTFQDYMDELLKDPVLFLNKLNSDEQFKNSYIQSYKSTSVKDANFDLLGQTKIKHLLNNGVVISGIIKDRSTDEIIKNFEASTYDEYLESLKFVQDEKAKGRDVMRIAQTPRLGSIKNGTELAQALNVPLGENWFK